MIKIAFKIALLGFLISSCKSGNEKIVYTPDKLVPTEKSLLWKISGNGLKKPSWLYGTIHMIPKKDFEMPETVRLAVDRSQKIAFEIDMKDMTNIFMQLSVMTKAFMAGGKTLKDLLPEEDYKFVRAKLSEKGLPAGMAERLKPMFTNMMFTTDPAGTEDIQGGGDMTSVEMEIFKMAKRRKLETGGLETVGYQMAIFDSIPYADQAQMLVESLRNLDKADEGGETELDKMIKLYKDQDIAGMHGMISEEQYGFSKYEDILLNKRNRNWIPVMGKMMREKPTLFAVGAGHLGGAMGVVALLRSAGYRVEVATE